MSMLDVDPFANPTGTVVCPGCEVHVDIEGDQWVDGSGAFVAFIPSESEHEALLRHWRFCSAQQRGSGQPG